MALRVLWDVVIPGLVAALILRFLVPPVGTGFAGAVALLGRRFGLIFGVALFLILSWMSRHWRYWIPGGRYASPLAPRLANAERSGERLAEWALLAARYECLISRRIWRRLPRSLDRAARTELAGRLCEFRDALLTGDLSAARAASFALDGFAAPVLAGEPARQAFTTVIAVALTATVTVALRATLVVPYQVMTASMLPSLEPADVIAGSKFAYRAPWSRSAGAPTDSLPRRGDVIVFRSATVALGARAGVPDVLVKRVIGLPGDKVAMQKGVPVINGWPLPSCDAGDYLYVQSRDGTMFHARLRVEFVEERAYLTVQGGAVPFDDAYLVRTGEVFVLGDNRSSSLDSRSWNQGRGGGVPTSGIEARVDRFLVGTHRSGETDWSRFLWRIGAIETAVRVEGLDERAVEEGIAKCLKNRPKETTPPGAGEAGAIRANRPLGT